MSFYYIVYHFNFGPYTITPDYLLPSHSLEQLKKQVMAHSMVPHRQKNTYFIREAGNISIFYACINGTELVITPELEAKVNAGYEYQPPIEK